MRSYVYVSDAKLDGFRIAPKLLDKIAKELKIDAKLASLTLKEKPDDSVRFAKLELVERHLAEEGLIGEIGSDAQWFEATLPMHWGPYVHHEGYKIGERERDYYPESPVILFAGQTPKVSLALGGSRQHVLSSASSLSSKGRSANAKTPLFTSHSDGYSIVRSIVAASGEDLADSQVVPRAIISTVDQVMFMTRMLPPPSVKLLALRLLDESLDYPGGRRRVILGTPLYVERDFTAPFGKSGIDTGATRA